MSRLIVKNLPKRITEEKLRNLFSQKGTITDIQLKYTKDGVFRQFAFIGYENEAEAETAIKYFHNSCIQTSKIKVELCAALGAETKPKSWSKYSTDSNVYKKKHGIDKLEQEQKQKEREGKIKPISKLNQIIGEHKDDPQFLEFMQVHDRNRNLWSNDAQMEDDDKNKSKKVTIEDSLEENDSGVDTKKVEDEEALHDSNSEISNESDEIVEKNVAEKVTETTKKLADQSITDLDYMKALMKGETKNTEKKEKNTIVKNEQRKPNLDLFTIKMHDIPYATKRQDVLKFFKPLKPFSIRLPTNVKGFCYVGFKLEKDFNKAMFKDKSFLKGKQVFFSDFTEKNKISKNQIDSVQVIKKNPKWQQQEESLKNEEDISETGKIFFRNLAYTIVEDDLTKLFEKYGPIAEINLPIDSISRKIKGFGTITFVMPEHAVTAFSELDGSTFHGRLLHLIPGKSNDNTDENSEGLSFKEKKELKLKKSASQSYNWNTLFMGANAVADILAKRFDKTKEQVLDSSSGGTDAAVRLALGETQLVMEMKKFLEDNDIELAAFETQPIKRSKTVILVKNLPAETSVAELRPLFEKFGLVGRIVLPPSGITALIEFLDPSESKKAFTKLAYSKFKSLPLYLEWAPENTFKTEISGEKLEDIQTKRLLEINVTKESKPDVKHNEIIEEIKEVEKHDDEGEDEDELPESETTLFLRNLNFKTREDVVRKHFNHLGKIHITQVAMRKDPEDSSKRISLGYGFIQFKKKITAEKALKEMQFTKIEGNQVELKRSDRTLKLDEKSARKLAGIKKQTGTKILVRNIPFQAKTKEVYQIFKTFGELRSVRLPKKTTPGEESHRGFGFVDYITKSDAKKAFEALCSSCHLYGRRLVLEWASVTDTELEDIRKRTAEDFGVGAPKEKKNRKAVFDDSIIPTTKDGDNSEEEENYQ